MGCAHFSANERNFKNHLGVSGYTVFTIKRAFFLAKSSCSLVTWPVSKCHNLDAKVAVLTCLNGFHLQFILSFQVQFHAFMTFQCHSAHDQTGDHGKQADQGMGGHGGWKIVSVFDGERRIRTLVSLRLLYFAQG